MVASRAGLAGYCNAGAGGPLVGTGALTGILQSFFAYWLPYVNLRLFDRGVMSTIEIVRYCTFPGRVFHYDEFASEIQGGRINLLVKESNQTVPPSLAGANLERFQLFQVIGSYMILRRED
jgi:hypothetical protein